MTAVGLIAGRGPLPLLAARGARAEGFRIVAVALREETDPALEGVVDQCTWVSVGQLGALIRSLQAAGVREAVMVGQVHLTHLFSRLRPDLRALRVLWRLSDRRGDSILAALADELEREGIRLLDSARFLASLVPAPGCLTRRAPGRREREDLAFGRAIARQIAALRIGQTVVVKRKVVLAVESIEGTDAAIRRGAALGRGDVVVAKVSRPDQDVRFDLPTVGPTTVATMREAGATALGLDAGRTLLVDREAMVAEADRAGIAIVAD
jgi:DUF1009 family protein